MNEKTIKKIRYSIKKQHTKGTQRKALEQDEENKKQHYWNCVKTVRNFKDLSGT